LAKTTPGKIKTGGCYFFKSFAEVLRWRGHPHTGLAPLRSDDANHLHGALITESEKLLGDTPTFFAMEKKRR
jgi:hypothetical protein